MNLALPMTAAEKSLGLSLPNRRSEEWKWTDLRRLLPDALEVAHQKVADETVDRLIATSPFAALKLDRIVFVNGRLDRNRSNLQAARVEEDGAPPAGLDGPIVDINRNLVPRTTRLVFEGNVERPVEILHVTTGGKVAVAELVQIEVAEGASASIVETYVGEGAYLHVPVTKLVLGNGARLDRVKLEAEPASAQHLSDTSIQLGQQCVLNDVTLTSGASLSRQNVTATLLGRNAIAKISGAYLLNGQQHVDTRLVVDHTVPDCTSRELFKCVMNDESRGIFQGKVIVRPDAQKTDGKQSSHALLLSERAEFDAKPELEIYADDVVCGHGATCGDLNHDHLFYLKSRGIPHMQAHAMLVAAFVEEALDLIEHEGIRNTLNDLVETRLLA